MVVQPLATCDLACTIEVMWNDAAAALPIGCVVMFFVVLIAVAVGNGIRQAKKERK